MGLIKEVRDFIRSRNSVIEKGEALVQTSGMASKSLITDEDHMQRSVKFKVYDKAYKTVPLITAIIDVQTDQTVQDFFFEGPSSKKLTKWASKVNLMQFFHRVAKCMLLYGNAYVEVISEGNEVVQLKVLDPIWIDVYRTATGDVIGYSQIINNSKEVLWGSTGNKEKDRQFKKFLSNFDHIVHFKHNVLCSAKYGLSVIHSLIDPLNTKISMENNLSQVIFKYVAPLIWAKVGNDQFPANADAVADISSTLRDLKAESEITTSHLVDLGVLQFNNKGMDIKTPLLHTEQQIVTGGQVPPVLLGRGQGVDRSTAEVQLRSFGRHIKTNQQELKIEFEDKILVGQGIATEEDKLIWVQSEEREREIEVDMLRGLVTDGVITPQKANDLLPPRFREQLPEIEPLNNQQVGDDGLQIPRDSQKKNNKVTDNKTDPTLKTMNRDGPRKRRVKSDRELPK